MYHKANLNRIMSEYTGQPIEKVRSDFATASIVFKLRRQVSNVSKFLRRKHFTDQKTSQKPQSKVSGLHQ